jgi:hypothetical protein
MFLHIPSTEAVVLTSAAPRLSMNWRQQWMTWQKNRKRWNTEPIVTRDHLLKSRRLKSPGQKESGDWAAPTHRSTQQSQKSYSKRWAMVNILYIAPSHQILKSVLSFFRFWYISKCYRFWRVYYINVFQTPAQFLKNKDVSNTSNTTLH